MTQQEFRENLHRICEAPKEALKELVVRARVEEFGYWEGEAQLPWADEWGWEDELDSLIEVCGFVYDRVNGRNRLSRNSTIKKLRKALGYNAR